jgi:hypothetical protein
MLCLYVEHSSSRHACPLDTRALWLSIAPPVEVYMRSAAASPSTSNAFPGKEPAAKRSRRDQNNDGDFTAVINPQLKVIPLERRAHQPESHAATAAAAAKAAPSRSEFDAMFEADLAKRQETLDEEAQQPFVITKTMKRSTVAIALDSVLGRVQRHQHDRPACNHVVNYSKHGAAGRGAMVIGATASSSSAVGDGCMVSGTKGSAIGVDAIAMGGAEARGIGSLQVDPDVSAEVQQLVLKHAANIQIALQPRTSPFQFDKNGRLKSTHR